MLRMKRVAGADSRLELSLSLPQSSVCVVATHDAGASACAFALTTAPWPLMNGEAFARLTTSWLTEPASEADPKAHA